MYTKEFKANEPIQVSTKNIGVKLDAAEGAKMYFSVDGDIYSEVDKEIDDVNIIVCNIPNGVYLKFNVAGEYTAD